MVKEAAQGQDVFCLSRNQMNIWALEQSLPGTSVNNITATVRITGRVDFVLLKKAVCLVLRSDSSLRTQIVLKNDLPMQYHAPYEEPAVQLLDFSATDAESIDHWVQVIAQTPLFAPEKPLYRFDMCRTGEGSAVLLVQTHHIISDGWSQLMLCNRIGQAYLALLGGNQPDWEPFPDYADYVCDEQNYLCSENHEKDRAYWQSVLENAGDAASLRAVRSSVVSHVGRRCRFALPQQLNQAVYAFCREHRVAPFAVFYMALATYLKRNGAGDRFTIGVPIFNRANFQYKQTTGMFVSTLPLCCEVDDSWSLCEFSEHFSAQWMELLRHQRFAFSEIEQMAASGPLFRMMLSYQDSQILENENASVHISGGWHYCGYQTEQLCIHLTNLEGNRVYAVDYDYLTQMFSRSDIENLHQYLCHILLAGLQSPELPICKLPLLSPEERERVLYGFNQTYAPRYGHIPYAQLRKTAQQTPRKVAVIYHNRRITYQELLHHGALVAAALPEAQKLAAVLLPRDERLYAAMVGIMQANCAWLLLSPELPDGRIEEILRQSRADYLISVPELCAPFADCGAEIVDMQALNEERADFADASDDDLAYVVYTSGSTGTPKGVEISQKSLMNLADAMQHVYGGYAVLSLCSVGFDAFVLESAAALLCGCTILLADEMQKERPDALADLIENYGLDYLSTTPSRLSALLDCARFSAAVRRLKCIVCGGEAFPAQLLQRLKACTSAKIYNQYGPSEAAVAVSMALLDNPRQITVGRPMENCHLYVLDEQMQPLPANVCGELYIGGACVGLGYRNADELTAASFVPSPFIHGETLYKTGDAACWTDEGEIVLSGRRDDQVKIRGLRIELQEISRTFCRHPQITSAAVRVLEHCGQQILAAYYVAEREIPELELLNFAASFLPGYMVPSRVMRVDTIPLTKNGKADLSKLPEPPEEEAGALASSATEAEILDVFRAVLHTPELYADSNYFLCGGNSLNAMETISLLENRFGVRLMVSDLYVCRNAKNLAILLSGSTVQTAGRVLTPAPECDFYPLSSTQKSMYLQSCLDPSGLAYHMPCAFRFAAAPDLAKLETAFVRLIADDALLRTRFVLKNGDVVAEVQKDVPFTLDVLQAQTEQEAFAQFVKPFDFAAAPLLRAALWRDPEGRPYLLVDLHHIICDGQSVAILLSRLDRFYRGEQAEKHLTLHDYTIYCQNEKAQNASSLDYWKKTLAGCPEFLDLPADKPRPQQFSFRGGFENTVLCEKASEAVDRLCRNRGLTAYMLFSALWGILFARLGGKDDVVIASPVSERSRCELQNVCGPLMGTLPLRLKPKGTVSAYLHAVKDSVLAMLDHADTSLDEILQQLSLAHTTDRNALYQVLFQVSPVDANAFSLGGITMEYVPISTNTAKLDLYIEAGKIGGRWQIRTDYASDIYNAETVSYYGRCLEKLILSLSEADDKTDVAELCAVSEFDLLRSIKRPNEKRYFYPDMTVQEAIAEETMLHPQSDAVIWHDRHVSFEQLQLRAAHIAGVLRKNGAEPGDRIGFVCHRSPDLLAGLLGILRCGCVYVPFLYDYPAERVAYMMQTADVRLILTDDAALLDEQACVRPVVSVEDTAEPFFDICPRLGTDAMYVLFTSGSTGKPKGVQLPHRALMNLLESMREWMRGEHGPFLCSTNVTFDIFITETLLALAQGHAVVLADDEQMLLPWELARLIELHRPGLAQFTPSRLQMCMQNDAFCHAIGIVGFTIMVGEAMPASLVARFAQFCPNGRLINMYGPTEAAVYVTAGALLPDRPVTIGTALHNCRIYVLDQQHRPVMPTARGELYLAGDCLADGYISRPDLTAQAFCDDPFFPGEKMYKSGDLGRVRIDGELECLGRVDAQVKINGNRVELGEIAEVLLAAGAKQACVFSEKSADGTDLLIAAVSPRDLSVQALQSAVSAKLPSYMMPSKFHLFSELAQNASGKTDLPRVKALISQNADEKQPPEACAVQPSGKTAGPTAEDLLAIWKQVLCRDDLREDVSFFEQSGTSMSALHILSEYYNRGIQMTLAQFYAAPTILRQAELLRQTVTPPAAETGTVLPDPDPSFQTGQVDEKQGTSLLLTGATGFLGAHLLKQFLENGEQSVICLIRDRKCTRLHSILRWYFGGNWLAANQTRIETVCGDICEERFGLDEQAYARLAARVHTVCHAAADVRHYAADENLMKTNLVGTQHAIALAKNAGARLIYISTASISGSFVASNPNTVHLFCEDDFEIGQNWSSNQYLRSKYLAERAVREAAAGGLATGIFRVGRLIGRTFDGAFQRNPESNAFYLIVQAVRALGALPSSMAQMPFEVSPVDACAAAIAALAKETGVFHVIEPQPKPLEAVLRRAVDDLVILPDDRFAEALAAFAKDDAAKAAALIDVWNGRDAAANVRVSSEKTHGRLKTLGYFWPEDVLHALDLF